MADAQTKAIDEFEFRIFPLTAWKGLKAFHSFTTILGPALAPLLRFGTGDKTAAAAGLLQVLPGALKTSTPEELEALAKVLLEGAQVKAPSSAGFVPLMPMIDTLLQGRLFTLFALLAWASQVHFGGFFSELAKRAGARASSQASDSSGSTSQSEASTSGAPVA